MNHGLLLTDLDNTLYNWVDFFGTSLRAMVHALSQSLQVDEEVVYGELRKTYEIYGTLEYKFVIQELPSFGRASDVLQQKALHAAIVAFSMARKKRLSLYDGTKDVFDWLSTQGVEVVGVTNAPALETLGRLRSLGLSGRLSGLVAWEGAEETRGLLEERISKSSMKWVRVLRQDQLKPNPAAYITALEAIGRDPSNGRLWVLGDSQEKDLRPASELGAVTIWAKYGREFSAKNFQTLLKVTHWSEDKVQSTYVASQFEADFTIGSLPELREIIPPRQGALFE
jgi:phosphoglycolate phosphatase